MSALITLQVGKRYAARSPQAPTVRIVGEIRGTDALSHCFHGSDGSVYTEDGHFANHGLESAFDLIAEAEPTFLDRVRSLSLALWDSDQTSAMIGVPVGSAMLLVRVFVYIAVVAIALASMPFIVLPFVGVYAVRAMDHVTNVLYTCADNIG